MAAVGVFLFVAAIGLLFSRSEPDSYDTGIMAEVAHSMVSRHDVTVPPDADVFHFNSPYASYGIGMSIVMAPAFALGPHVHVSPASLYMSANGILFGATAVAMYALCLGALGAAARIRTAAFTAVVVSVASPLLPFVATGLSEMGCALGVATGLAGIAWMSRGRRPGIGAMVAGLGSSLAIVMRPDSLILVVPILGLAVLVVHTRRLGTALAYALGVTPGVLVTAVYNAVRFGSPARFGYNDFFIFNHSLLAGIYGLTLSPSRGLLLYAPLVIVAAIGTRRMWRRAPVLAGAAIALLAVRIVFYSTYWSWSAGVTWGPRFLVPAVPVLALGMIEVFSSSDRSRAWRRTAVAIVLVVSFGVQVVGATVEPAKQRLWAAIASAPIHYAPGYTDFAAVATAPRTGRIMDHYLFDWSYFPITDEASQLAHGHNLVGRYLSPHPNPGAIALLLLVAAAGAALIVSTGAEPSSQEDIDDVASGAPAG